MSTFFTLYNSQSFYNPSLSKSMNVSEKKGNSEFIQLVSSEVAPINRFNVTFWGLKNEEKMLHE